ncbi:MAG: 1,4-alpha-glucan branching protein GlgB, partial [Clostridia bacterium]|nr:1,4-alpha-glucan branching protein GlgB [Clostridia bacterium]
FFHQGSSDSAYHYLGCHVSAGENGYTYAFRVWAPRAEAVFLISDFTGWDNGLPLRRITEKGIYEAVYSSPVSLEGKKYKFRVRSDQGIHDKGDPFAFASVGKSDGASVICHPSSFVWGDRAFLAERRRKVTGDFSRFLSVPLHIYECHAGSFDRREDGTYLSYKELADRLIPYVKYMGYTHIELMPLAEYPFDGSWGYQVCGYYAPTSRYGVPDDFRYLVNACHQAGIGVIMDWVPAHFPKDEWGLYEFDGHPQYEYQGKDRMESRSWGTRFFDLGRKKVQSFLISNAMYWLREFHLDGLRVDAVASMLYLDYDRDPGEWIPNKYGEKNNLEAVAFLQKLNQTVDREYPDALMIAEESGTYGGVTKPVSEGGLGFNLKWNMGFANDFFVYLATDPLFRKYKHSALNFPIMYTYGEHYVLPISHDEVVHGKKSFLDKAYGSYEDKFKTFRAALLFMMSFPGKKMEFMGTEYGQFSEWDEKKSLEWFMLKYDTHRDLREFVRALNMFYLSSPCLWERDFDPSGFSWISADDRDRNAVAYKRRDSEGNELLVAVSFSGSTERLSLPGVLGRYQAVFDATGELYGKIFSFSPLASCLTLPPFGAVYLSLISDEINAF